jgi:hypothetical protein
MSVMRITVRRMTCFNVQASDRRESITGDSHW